MNPVDGAATLQGVVPETSDQPLPEPRRASRPARSWEAPWRPVVRFLAAVGAALALCAAIWSLVPTTLSVTTDIVGYPTFANFDIERYLDAFDVLGILFPLLSVALYLLISWRGPLARARSGRPWPPLLVPAPSMSATAPATAADRSAFAVIGSLLRVGLPALAVAVGVSIARSPHVSVVTGAGYTAGAIYWLAVLGAGLLVARDAAARPAGPEALTAWRAATARVNAYASIVVVPVLYLVSRSTTVTIASDRRVVHYEWFPIWLTVLLVLAVFALCVRGSRRLPGPVGALRLESRVLLYLVGPVLIFLFTASLPGASGWFQGFDDAQALTGAQLTFGHGLFPWRDISLLHGLLMDDFYAALGFGVFANSRWGANAAFWLFIVPMSWISLYLFVVHFARRNKVLIFGLSSAMVLAYFLGWAGTRFILLPIALILFEVALRKATARWCVLFVFTLVLASILTPEITLLAVGMVVVLVAFEWVHRAPGSSLRRSFPRTLWCAASGAVLLAVWALFLLAEGALSAFVDYYRVTATGHELWGGEPLQFSLHSFQPTIELVVPVLLLWMTVWRVTAKLLRRSSWTTREWTMVAAATFVPLYYTKALDRPDAGHVFEMFATVVPLLILWIVELVEVGDRWMRARATTHWLRASLPLAPVTTIVVVASIGLAPISIASLRDTPVNFHPVVPAEIPAVAKLGYTEPGIVPQSQIFDLGAVLDRYAGANGPVFDFANQEGLIYYLLNRVPASRFYHVEAAQTTLAQQIVIGDLEKSRPAVVVYFDTTFGLFVYDQLTSMERNYAVSQYILDHYTPLLDIDGQLVMIRNDLAASAPPPPSGLSSVPQTTGLYFDTPICNWGYVPNFLVVPPNVKDAQGTSVPVASSIARRQGSRLVIATPPGADLASYQWLELTASAPFGDRTFQLSDGSNQESHTIAFSTLPRVGDRVYVRVGSCSQWHGYTPGDPLFLVGADFPPGVQVHLVR